MALNAQRLNRHGRTALAVIFGPPTGGAIVFFVQGIFTDLMWLARFGETSPTAGVLWALPFFGAAVGGFVGIPAMLVAGLPAHALLSRHRQRSVFVYAAAGALAGIVVALVVGAFGWLTPLYSDMPPEEFPPSNLMSAIWTFPQAAILGACSAASFWLIRRPDRDPPNPTTPQP